MIALFNYFPTDSKIALLYPENFYGYQINSIIDDIAKKSKSLIINRASYKEDLTNARLAIKELGKFEFRKHELERQKIILKNKDDIVSKNALKKIKKFETLGEVDFTHIILPDYGIRLLEIAPLLPFYDVDPNKVQFVGTGVWDDRIFFNEPSLQNAIFSGIEFKKRRKFFEDYLYIYNEKPLRISTIPYDLVGILSYLLIEKPFRKKKLIPFKYFIILIFIQDQFYLSWINLLSNCANEEKILMSKNARNIVEKNFNVEIVISLYSEILGL